MENITPNTEEKKPEQANPVVPVGIAQVSLSDFQKLDIRVGKIIEALDFPEAKKPAYKLRIDFQKLFGCMASNFNRRVKDPAPLHGITALIFHNVIYAPGSNYDCAWLD